MTEKPNIIKLHSVLSYIEHHSPVLQSKVAKHFMKEGTYKDYASGKQSIHQIIMKLKKQNIVGVQKKIVDGVETTLNEIYVK